MIIYTLHILLYLNIVSGWCSAVKNILYEEHSSQNFLYEEYSSPNRNKNNNNHKNKNENGNENKNDSRMTESGILDQILESIIVGPIGRWMQSMYMYTSPHTQVMRSCSFLIQTYVKIIYKQN